MYVIPASWIIIMCMTGGPYVPKCWKMPNEYGYHKTFESCAKILSRPEVVMNSDHWHYCTRTDDPVYMTYNEALRQF